MEVMEAMEAAGEDVVGLAGIEFDFLAFLATTGGVSKGGGGLDLAFLGAACSPALVASWLVKSLI